MTGESISFKTEVSKLLDIVINSLYSDRQIFLRELISNASDACDKLRYLALTKPGIAEGDGGFRIEIIPDSDKNTIEIRDNGVGMNKHDLMNELGTIAHSGTGEFIKNISGDSSKDVNLIGQFGVGFYSAFMVAEKVEVRSRKAGEELGWLWTSDGKNGYNVEETEDLKRGTSIVLYLKEDQKEYADTTRIRNIVRTYSDHIAHPVILFHKGEAETINEASALWAKNKNDVTEEQYKEFYRHVSHAFDEPYITIHYKAEGSIEYTGLLFVPSRPPFDLFQPERKTQLKLYVNRVFISDSISDLLPSWLRFVKGVVDCKDLPLNISREMLQRNPLINKVRNGLIRKVIDEISKKAKEGDEYEKFWESFGAVIKEGIYEDHERREDIAGLCRFHSSLKDGMIGLDEYIENMNPDQKSIYFLTGDNLDILRKNPQIEGFTARGINVLLMVDPIDEFWPQSLPMYKLKHLKSAHHASDELAEIKVIDEEIAKIESAPKDQLDKLCSKLKEIFGEEIKDVRTTERLTNSPVCLTTGEGEMSIHLERLMRNHQQQAMFPSSRILEINPRHALISTLAANVESKGDSNVFKDAAFLLLDQAKIIEGEAIKDPSAFAARMTGFMTSGINM